MESNVDELDFDPMQRKETSPFLTASESATGTNKQTNYPADTCI
jgi:hypothetical protein